MRRSKYNQLLKSARGISGANPFCVSTLADFLLRDCQMKQIKLTQNQFAIVDNKNYKWLNQWKWFALWAEGNKSFYAVRMSNRKNGKQYKISMAREILGLTYGDKRESDHRNHNTLDNRESNLRIVTHQQNLFNYKKTKGYCWNETAKKYHAYIGINNKMIYLGLFNTAKQAHNAYLEAKELYHKI